MPLSMSELLVVAVVAVVLFGYKKIPDVAKHLGGGLRSFKKALNEPDEIDITPKKNDTDDNKNSQG